MLDDGSANLDDTPPETGRFENGTLTIGTAPTTITVSPVTGNGDNRVAFPQASIAGLPFSAYDNDVFSPAETISGTITEVERSGASFVWTLNVTTSSETPIDWPDFVGGKMSVGGGTEVAITAASSGLVATSALDIPCIVRDDDLPNGTNIPSLDRSALVASFANAYVLPQEDAGTADLSLTFIANITGDTATEVRTGWKFDAAQYEADPLFWTVYLRGAFQHQTTNDSDPDSEGAILGIVDDINGQGANIYEEVLRTAEFTPNVALGRSEAHTVAHEIGHLFNGIHADGGLMAQTIIRTSPDFSAVTLVRIRSIPNP